MAAGLIDEETYLEPEKLIIKLWERLPAAIFECDKRADSFRGWKPLPQEINQCKTNDIDDRFNSYAPPMAEKRPV